jgi:hypothetical protein
MNGYIRFDDRRDNDGVVDQTSAKIFPNHILGVRKIHLRNIASRRSLSTNRQHGGILAPDMKKFINHREDVVEEMLPSFSVLRPWIGPPIRT